MKSARLGNMDGMGYIAWSFRRKVKLGGPNESAILMKGPYKASRDEANGI